MILQTSLFTLALAGLVSLSPAAENPDTTKTYELDPIVVTATNTGTARSLLPNSLTVVSERHLQRTGETSVFQVLNRQVPGMFVTERGLLGYGVGAGAAGAINIRGAGGSPTTQVLVLTDGRPTMMGLFGHPIPDMYMTPGVERVEVIRGPASLIHGTNAFGGVVNMISRQDVPQGMHGNVSASVGSYATQKLQGGVLGGFGSSGVRLDLSHASTNGHRPYSSFRSSTASGKVSTLLGESFSLRVDGLYTDLRTYDPGPASTPYVDHWVNARRGNAGFVVENTTGPLEGAFKGYLNFGRHEIYDGFRSNDNDMGLMLHQSLKLGETTVLTAGADVKRYGGDAQNVLAPVDFGEFHVTETGLYALFQQDVWTVLRVTAGARLNHHELAGNAFLPQAGIAVNVWQGSTFKASLGRGFRSPTIRELYLFPAPTPTLKPEDAWTYEAGYTGLVADAVSLELVGYVMDGKNLIRTSGTYPNLVLSNSGSFVHRGVEFASGMRLGQGFRVDLNYTYLDPGAETQGNPRHKLYLGGEFATELWRASAGLHYVAGLYGADNSRKRLDDYLLLQARAGVTLAWNLELYLSVENILDVQYATVYDYPMPGRVVMGGVSWSM
jgi:iron complex outermembrane receptor protein